MQCCFQIAGTSYVLMSLSVLCSAVCCVMCDMSAVWRGDGPIDVCFDWIIGAFDGLLLWLMNFHGNH